MIRSVINHFKENLKKNCKECEKQTEKDLLRKLHLEFVKNLLFSF